MTASTKAPTSNGHPDCRDCHGKSLFWRPDGEAVLCERCRSCCECTCGEPFTAPTAGICEGCGSDDGSCYCNEWKFE